MSMMLRPVPLTAHAFQEFGDVIQADSRSSFGINQGTTERFHDLARVEVTPELGGRPLINIFRCAPRGFPLDVILMEKHPLGSQAFYPLSARPYLVVVAPPTPKLDVTKIVAFHAARDQGVNFATGVWHHPLLTLEATSDFIVVDRGDAGDNYEEVEVPSGTLTIELD
jgi:ureidoglycolate lyase